MVLILMVECDCLVVVNFVNGDVMDLSEVSFFIDGARVWAVRWGQSLMATQWTSSLSS